MRPDRYAQHAGLLGLTVTDDSGTAVIRLEHAGQDLRFVRASGGGEAITEVRLTADREIPPVQIAGVRFVSAADSPGARPCQSAE